MRIESLIGRMALVASLLIMLSFPVVAAPLPVTHAPELPSFAQPISEQLSQQLQTLIKGPQAANTDDQSDEPAIELTPTLGTRALNFIIGAGEILRQQVQIFVTNFAALPELSGWFQKQTKDQHLVSHWNAIGYDLCNYVGIPLLGAILLELCLFFVRLSLRRRQPKTFGGRLATVLILFVLRSLPIILFVTLSVTILSIHEPQKFPRYILFNFIYAITLCRVIVTVLRGLFAPTTSHLRLLPLTSEAAIYLYRWLSAFSLIIVGGYFFEEIAKTASVPDTALIAFSNIIGLILVLMTIIVILQNRGVVAALLRGHISSSQEEISFLNLIRLRASHSWHLLAIAYLVIGYVIVALGVSNGRALMLRGTVVSVFILVAVRVFLNILDRWAARSGDSITLHHAILRLLCRVVIWILATAGIAFVWGVDIGSLISTPLGQHVLGSAFSIGLTIVVLTLVYEMISSSIDRHLNRRGDDGRIKASARARTLLPMVRNTLFIMFAVASVIVILSEIGVNISPILAGAGVLGVAVGFGSQTLVKDFLTGLFIVSENSMAVGDYVKLGDHAGTIEAISIRTVRLRDFDGSLHILPFSEVTNIVNMTKDFSYAVINVAVAYDTDLEHAMNVIRSIGTELQKDPVYKRVILDSVEIMGVDQLGDSSITLMARLRTRPGKQWEVRRMFLLRLKQRFDAEKIEIPFPSVIHINK